MQILYRRHLHIELSNSKDIEKFAFCDPNPAFKLNADFEDYIVERLAKGDTDGIFFLPHNHNKHWILSIIWEGQIYILNPLSHPVRFPALEKALTSAVSSFNMKIGKSGDLPKVKNLTWSEMSRVSYDEEELEDVRCEVLEFIQSHV
ncbi:hypothetical protein ACET3Z_013243 [Daucus carota]